MLNGYVPEGHPPHEKRSVRTQPKLVEMLARQTGAFWLGDADR